VVGLPKRDEDEAEIQSILHEAGGVADKQRRNSEKWKGSHSIKLPMSDKFRKFVHHHEEERIKREKQEKKLRGSISTELRDELKAEKDCPFCEDKKNLNRKERWVNEDSLSEYAAKMLALHKKDPDAFHANISSPTPEEQKEIERRMKEPREEDDKKLKAEEGMGGMNMGAQRGLGHEAGYKQDPGQSAQITEVPEEVEEESEGEKTAKQIIGGGGKTMNKTKVQKLSLINNKYQHQNQKLMYSNHCIRKP